MNPKETKLLIIKIIAAVLTVLIILSFYLFFARKIEAYVFWIVVIVCAVAGYWVLPKIRKKIEA